MKVLVRIALVVLVASLLELAVMFIRHSQVYVGN